MCTVLENRECLLDDSCGIRRNGQDVNGLVEAREGVEVCTESHPDRFQVLDEIVLREVCGSVECRVLDHVRLAELVRLLENGPCVHDEPQLCALLRFWILADVVANTVRKRSDPHLRIDRQWGRERRHCCGGRGRLCLL